MCCVGECGACYRGYWQVGFRENDQVNPRIFSMGSIELKRSMEIYNRIPLGRTTS